MHSTVGMASKVLREYKLVLVGGVDVGKSCLVTQLILNRFEDNHDPTLMDSYRKQCVIDDRVVLLDVCDTAEQEECRPVHELALKTGEGVLLVYSIASKHSFEEVKIFIKQLQHAKNGIGCSILIVGNKCDLKQERAVSKEEGQAMATSLNCKFMETSAKRRINVAKSFYELVREINKNNKDTLEHGAPQGKPNTTDDKFNPEDSGNHANCCSKL